MTLRLRSIAVTLLCAVIAPIVSAQSDASTVRVGLIPIEAPNEQIPAAATGAIDDTLLVTLQFLPGYTAYPLSGTAVSAVSTTGQPVNTTGLAQIATAETLDHIVFGTATRRSDGGVAVDLRVFNHATGDVAHRKRDVAGSMIDLFDLSDRLIVSLIEEFSDVRVQYGRLAIVVPDMGRSDASARATITVDAIPVSEELRSVTIERMVAGDHTVSIDGVPVGWEQTVTVRPGETATVNPLIPGVDEDTRDRIDVLVNRIAEVFTIRRGDRTVDDEIARARETIRETAGFYGQELHRKFEAMESGLTEMLDTPDRDDETGLRLAGDPIAAIRPNFAAPLGGGAAVPLGTRLALLSTSLPPYAEIEIDGDDGDWTGIPAMATDASGDVHPESDLPDIAAIHIAMDQSFIYMRFAVPDGRIPPAPDVRYDMSARGLRSGQRLLFRIESGNRDALEASVAVFDGDDSYITRTRDTAVATGPTAIEARFPLVHVRELLANAAGERSEADGMETLTFQSFSCYIDTAGSIGLPPNKRTEQVEFTPTAYVLY